MNVDKDMGFPYFNTTNGPPLTQKAFEANMPLETSRLSPQCCVFETNLAANAFHKKVLHMAGASAKNRRRVDLEPAANHR
jgi:hypothetical protein